jgi:hypothetical protein
VDCREFVDPNLEPPAEEEPAAPRGRPRKTDADQVEEAKKSSKRKGQGAE